MLLVQISDLHITEPGALLFGRVDTAAYLRRCVARIAALATPPDAVIVTGDLVDRGAVREYAALRELLAPLAMPTHVLVGNHDDRDALRSVFDVPRDFVQYAFDLGALRVIALDTLDPGKPGGRLCDARRAWLDGQLAAAAGRPTIIAMHHPPFTTGIPFMDACSLDRDSSEALRAAVARHGNVERIICGHVHRSIHARFAGTIVTTAPSCAHQVLLGFAADTPAAAALEPPGFLQHAWIPPALVTHHTYVDAPAAVLPF